MTTIRTRVNRTLVASALIAGGATVEATGADSSESINACVNPHSGEIRIIQSMESTRCRRARGSHRPRWTCWSSRSLRTSRPCRPSGVVNLQYVVEGMYPNTSVSRAFCLPE